MRVGFYVGTLNDPVANAARVFRAWGEYLAGTHELELYGATDGLPTAVTDPYDHVETVEVVGGEPVADIRGARAATIAYCRRRCPDLVGQVWKYKVHAPGVSIAARQSGVPVLIRYQGDTFNEFRALSGLRRAGVFALDHVVGRLPLRLASHAIVLGPYGRRQVTARGVDERRTTVLPPPLDPEGRFTPPADREDAKKALDLPTDRPVALYVGRLTRLKGMPFLREVVQLVTADRELTFVLVGEGPMKKTLERAGDRADVRTPGFVAPSAVPDYYRAADVYVHPSPYEGIPLVVLEALETELPVVARDAGDIGSVIDTTVERPGSMAAFLCRDPASWETTWRNRELFDRSTQRERLERAMAEAVRR